MSDDVLVKAEGISKKFCRSLKRSLWYGVNDVASELLGRKECYGELRKNEFWAVDDVSFELRRGECLGMIGPNGAGKSTLLKMLNGLIKPDKGRIKMYGRIGALIELGSGFNPILTARENIYVNGSILGFTKKETDRKFEAIIDFAELEDFVNTPVQSFSSGMKVRLGFAIAAQMEPDVLIIDEVLAVGDTGFQMKCLNQMSRLSKKAAIILVSHSMPMVSRMSSKLLALNSGHLQFLGDDVPKGIACYLQSVQHSWEKFESSGYFQLRSFEISSSNQSKSGDEPVFALGQSIIFRLRFNVLKTSPDFIVNISFVDVESKMVAQCSSSNSEFVCANLHNDFTIELRLPELLLNSGRYSINIGLVEHHSHEHRGEILYQCRGIKTLNVEGGMGAISPVQFIGTWRYI